MHTLPKIAVIISSGLVLAATLVITLAGCAKLACSMPPYARSRFFSCLSA